MTSRDSIRGWVTGERWSARMGCWFTAVWRIVHDRRAQGPRGREKLGVRRCAAGTHPDHRGGGENADWRAGGWLGSEERVCPATADTWRPTDPRCSSPAAESGREYAIASNNPGRWW